MIKTYSINEEFLRNLEEYKRLAGLKKDSTAIQQAVIVAKNFFLASMTPISVKMENKNENRND